MTVFLKLESDEEYQPVLRQINERQFALVEGFRYVGSAGPFELRPEQLEATDLTSVPWLLRWFIPKYGRHTPAALLHDYQVDAIDRTEADSIFRITLGELRVGYIRREIMWAAVTMATRFKMGGITMLLLVLWVLAMLVGVGSLTYGLLTTDWAMVGISLVAPLPASMLWTDKWVAGIWAGYGVGVVGVPSLAIVVFVSGYWVSDRIVAAFTSQPPPTSPRAF